MKKNAKKISLIIILLALTIPFIIYVITANSTITFESEDPNFLDNSFIIEYEEEYNLPKVTAQATLPIFNLTKKLNVNTTNNIDATKIGKYTINYSTDSKLYKASKEIEVYVVDTKVPTITLITDENYYIAPNEEYVEEGYSAYDNYDKDITDKVIVTNNGDYTITYSVTDSSGNKTEVTRYIKVKDNDVPVLTINAKYLTIQKGKSFKIPSYNAIDETCGDLTKQVKVTHNINKDKVGQYKITYSVCDNWGNQASSSIDVYVYEVQKDNTTANPNGKNIYLTFDDGPAGFTSKLLSILDKYNVKATFFVTNDKPAYRNMIGEEYRKGHTVAVHTYTHVYRTVYASSEAFWSDMDKMNEIIYQQTGSYSHYLRFPGGSSNTVSKFNKGIITQLAKEIEDKGYIYYDWNVTSGDAGGTKIEEQVFINVRNGCSKRNNSIVLQHDIKGYSVNAVDRIIAWGLANGYTFVAINDSAPTAHHRIAN